MKKRVISFSVWGSNHAYTQGAVENAKLQPKIYPGWVCRFYCDTKVPPEIIKELKDLGSEIIMKPESDGFAGLYWRFEAMYDDPNIERFIIRDTDSRLNGREADAVQEWIDSGLIYHQMRDNPAHNIQVMGGMWGAIPGLIPEFENLMSEWISNLKPDLTNPKPKYHGTDQVFLCGKIWPYMSASNISHDEYFQYTGRERPFRVELKRDGYVGMVYSDKDIDRCEVKL